MFLFLLLLDLHIQLYSVSLLPCPLLYLGAHLSLTAHPLHCSLFLLYVMLPLVLLKLSSLLAIAHFRNQGGIPRISCSLELSLPLSAAFQQIHSPPFPRIPGLPPIPGFPQPSVLICSATRSDISLFLPCLNPTEKQREEMLFTAAVRKKEGTASGISEGSSQRKGKMLLARL